MGTTGKGTYYVLRRKGLIKGSKGSSSAQAGRSRYGPELLTKLNRKSERIPRSAPSPKLLCRVGDLLRGAELNSLRSQLECWNVGILEYWVKRNEDN